MIGNTNSVIGGGKDSLDLRFQGKLKKYTIPDGVTNIRPYMFHDSGEYVGGTTFTLADSIESIESYAFARTEQPPYVAPGNTIMNIPSNLKTIGAHSFSGCNFPNDLILPEGLTSINKAFHVISANNVVIPSTVKTLGDQIFSRANITSAIIRNGVTKITGRVFEQSTITTVYIPNSITSITTTSSPFVGCTALEFVTIEDGFNADNLNLSNSTKYSAETIVSWLEALADRTGQDTYTLTIGATNLAKLTPEDIAIATSKNWTLA